MNSSRFYSRLIDLIVLTSSFLLLTVITDIGNPMKFPFDLMVFVAVMFISLRLCKRIVFEHVHTSSIIACVLLANVTGLVVGALLVMLIDQFFAGIAESALIVILSSVLAFFIFGTLSPMIKSSRQDIIHH